MGVPPCTDKPEGQAYWFPPEAGTPLLGAHPPDKCTCPCWLFALISLLSFKIRIWPHHHQSRHTTTQHLCVTNANKMWLLGTMVFSPLCPHLLSAQAPPQIRLSLMCMQETVRDGRISWTKNRHLRGMHNHATCRWAWKIHWSHQKSL